MPADKGPNILIIHADQHRWDCLGAYGNPDVRTPNIDAVATDGVEETYSVLAPPARARPMTPSVSAEPIP